MKKKVIIFLLLLQAFFVNSQSIFDNFDNAACDGNTCSLCAINFINGGVCLPSWRASHGTPNTFGVQHTFVTAPDFVDLRSRLSGQCLITWWSSSLKSEGALRSFSFRKDICYKISMKVAASLSDQNNNPNTSRVLKIWAGKNIPIQGCCISQQPTPNIPSANKEIIGVKNFPASNMQVNKFTQWETIEFYFRTTKNDLNQIWLYPEVAGSGEFILAIEDFSVEEKCSSNIILDQTNLFYSGNFASTDYISVGSNLGLVQFAPYENTELKAGTRIILGRGTRINILSSNNSFVAKIEPCPLESSSCNSPYPSGISRPPNIDDVPHTNRSIMGGNDFIISPNPSNGVFNVLADNNFQESDSEKEIEVYNILGAKVQSGKFIGREYRIDISNRPSGNYLVRIKIADKLLTYKIVKE